MCASQSCPPTHNCKVQQSAWYAVPQTTPSTCNHFTSAAYNILAALHGPAPQPYSATDHTKYGKHAKKCPASAYCTNCMPLKVRPTFQLRVEPWLSTAALWHPAAFMRSAFALVGRCGTIASVPTLVSLCNPPPHRPSGGRHLLACADSHSLLPVFIWQGGLCALPCICACCASAGLLNLHAYLVCSCLCVLQVEAPGQEAMMSEILARGPVTCGMATAELFDYGENKIMLAPLRLVGQQLV